MYELKNFAFFDAEPIASTHETLRRLEFISSTVVMRSGDVVQMYFGDAEGYIWVVELSPELSSTPTFFAAHTGPIPSLQQVPIKNLLVTCGLDGQEEVVKVWDIAGPIPQDGTSPPLKNMLKLFPAKSLTALPVSVNFNPKLKLKFNGNPLGIQDERIISAPTSVISCLHVADDGSAFVCCLSGGTEFIFSRGDIDKDRNPKMRRLSSRLTLKNIISIFVFRSVSLGMHFVYALYTDTVVFFRWSLKGGDSYEEVLLDPAGIRPQCGAMMPYSDGYLVVASRDAVMFYGGRKRLEECAKRNWDISLLKGSGCKAPSEKRYVTFKRDNVLLVSCPDPEGHPEKFQFSIVEQLRESYLRVFNTKDATNLQAVICTLEDIILICQDAKSAPDVDLKFQRIKEKDIQAKVDSVIRKEDFEVAVGLSEKYDFDAASRADIHRQYGDSLYEKAAYDNAISQYVCTIGSLEPSYVIRRFLDPQRIRELAQYMEELHDERHVGIATPEHTTLLLKCLAKLQMTEKFNNFLQKPSLRFDVDTAISVCMNAGLYDQASLLARKVQGHKWFVKILLERHTQSAAIQDSQQSKMKEQYATGNLTVRVVCGRSLLPRNVFRKTSDPYVKVFARQTNDQETLLLQTPTIDDVTEPDWDPAQSTVCIEHCRLEAVRLSFYCWDAETLGADNFIGYMVMDFQGVPFKGSMEKELVPRPNETDKLVFESRDRLGKITIAWEYVPRSTTASTGGTIDQNFREALKYIHSLPLDIAEELLMLYAKTLMGYLPIETTTVLIEACTEWGGTKVGAHRFLHVFVGYPRSLLQFLESVVAGEQREGPECPSDVKAVYNALLELYLMPKLSSYTNGIEDTNAVVLDDLPQRHTKAFSLLRNFDGKYDDDVALILVRIHNFEEGILYMLSKLQLYVEILFHHMEVYCSLTPQQIEEREVVMDRMHSTCTKHGEQEPTLWVNMFYFLVEKTDDMSSISIVLAEIERRNLLSPLMVLDIVTKSSLIQLDTIRDYVVNQLTLQMAGVDKDQIIFRQSSVELASLRVDVHAQLTSAQVFQSNKCAACNRQLELPAVHFMCRHSFHSRCLMNVKECNLCAPNHRSIIAKTDDMAAAVNDHEVFLEELNEAVPENRLGVMTKCFSKAMFNAQYETPPGRSSQRT